MVGALGFTVSTVMFTGLEAFEVPSKSSMVLPRSALPETLKEPSVNTL
jgi:hypothetical protein